MPTQKHENVANSTRSTIPDQDTIPDPGTGRTAELRKGDTLMGTSDPDMPGTSDVGEFPTEEDTEQGDDFADDDEMQKDAEGLTAPTSSDVGKQTLTKADLGYDVYKEGVPEDEVAVKGHEHPDDPSAHEESEYAPGTKRK